MFVILFCMILLGPGVILNFVILNSFLSLMLLFTLCCLSPDSESYLLFEIFVF